VQRCESRSWVVCGRGRERSGLDDGSACEVVVEDGLAIGFEDGFADIVSEFLLKGRNLERFVSSTFYRKWARQLMKR